MYIYTTKAKTFLNSPEYLNLWNSPNYDQQQTISLNNRLHTIKYEPTCTSNNHAYRNSDHCDMILHDYTVHGIIFTVPGA